MIERLVILLAAAIIAATLYLIFQRWQVRRAAALAPTDPLLASLRPGIPAILYFTTPSCVPCTTQQRPALQRLLSELGDGVQVIEVNALEQPEAADRWGVMSIPTTFILDAGGTPRQINYGVAGLEKLRQQIAGV